MKTNPIVDCSQPGKFECYMDLVAIGGFTVIVITAIISMFLMERKGHVGAEKRAQQAEVREMQSFCDGVKFGIRLQQEAKGPIDVSKIQSLEDFAKSQGIQ